MPIGVGARGLKKSDAKLKTAWHRTQSITAADTIDENLTGTQDGIDVISGSGAPGRMGGNRPRQDTFPVPPFWGGKCVTSASSAAIAGPMENGGVYAVGDV
jgi:hypothetical protein